MGNSAADDDRAISVAGTDLAARIIFWLFSVFLAVGLGLIIAEIG